MSRRKVHFNDLPVETVTNVVQLLVDWRSSSGDAFPYVPPSFPCKGFLSPIASLSRVNKILRSICLPYLFSCLSCHTLRRVNVMLQPRAFISRELVDHGLRYVKTLSIFLPRHSVDATRRGELEKMRHYEEVIGKQVACIPGMYDSIHCLRLHNVPNLDDFFNALRSTHCLRLLDLLICDSVLGAQKCLWSDYEDIPAFREKIIKNIPPLESLRIKFAFGYENRTFSDRNRVKTIHYIMALIGATESTLLDLSVVANNDISMELLKTLHFPRLRRLALRSLSGKSSGFHKLILAHSAHLEEVNIVYDESTETHVTLSAISRIVRGISPREGGHKDSALAAEDAVDSLVHPEDGKWGHYECESFGYAKRSGEVVELSLSLPMLDLHGNDIDANKDLGITNLVDFLVKYEHLEVLTLIVGGYDEGSFWEIMDVFEELCHRSLRKLRSLNIFVELDRFVWERGSSWSRKNNIVGDETWSDVDFGLCDDEKDFTITNVPRLSVEERAEKWKKFEEEHYPTVRDIMSSFLKKAPSVKEVVWHLWYPEEGEVSSCWTWRRAKTKVRIRSNEDESETSCMVIGDLKVDDVFQMPERFTYAIGREATYLKTFEYRG